MTLHHEPHVFHTNQSAHEGHVHSLTSRTIHSSPWATTVTAATAAAAVALRCRCEIYCCKYALCLALSRNYYCHCCCCNCTATTLLYTVFTSCTTHTDTLYSQHCCGAEQQRQALRTRACSMLGYVVRSSAQCACVAAAATVY
jgi:hypothetical protein